MTNQILENKATEYQVRQDLFNFFIKQTCQNCNHSLGCIENTLTGSFSIYCPNCMLFGMQYFPGWSIKIEKVKSFTIRFVNSYYINISSCYVYDNNFKIIESMEFSVYKDFLHAIYNFETIYKKYYKLSVLF